MNDAMISSKAGIAGVLRSWAALAMALTLCLAAPPRAAERLGAFPVDRAQVSVAGISSGAFMANQLHVAHSADIMGAAMIAGGLYGCAVQAVEDNGVLSLASQATNDCMQVPFLLNDVAVYKDLVEQFAANGWIDSPGNLARSKVYLFTGSSDGVVNSATVEKTRDLYAALGVPADNIVFEDHSGPAAAAGHSWVTINFGGECSANDTPYINHCGYDQASAELKAIYGQDLNRPAAALQGLIVAFDQTEFVPGGAAAANGLSDTGYVYVPSACGADAVQLCRLHVVLHGCKQSAEQLGDEFYTKIGVNEWADANRIIVLYPQVHAITAIELPPDQWGTWFSDANLVGCWNWWGYAEDSRYLTKKGVQIDAIWKMVERIEGK
jgi:poly(3-hydroxybutyrate) depolymerase